jgi:triacylglycerol esterase/lipase EstA (alpha/beta hydrolase family)
MARILNLVIIILEVVSMSNTFKSRGFVKNFVFYTQLSNMMTFSASLLLVIFGQKDWVEVLRFLSVSMLVMTFFVTACILVPWSRKAKELLFSGSGLYHHTIIPILSTLTYMLFEKRAPFHWIWLPGVLTLIYGLVMLYFNYIDVVDGPYPFFKIKQQGIKVTVLWMFALFMAVTVFSVLLGYHKPSKTDIKYIYVHGLSGWGSYDAQYEYFPYWGMFGGDVVRYMNEQGYESYAASVDPSGSAWDRACELYAQLAGTRVDYGLAHSRAAGHERFGEDFTGRALVKNFDSSKVALIGHSFGGATIRLFSEILRNGSEEERQATGKGDISPFFQGGNGDNLVAVVTLAAPTNGTTAYDLYEDESFDLEAIEIPAEYEKNSDAVSKNTKAEMDGRESWDYAAFDMHIDNALALNERITTFDDVYYFAYPCSSAVENPDGSVAPDPEITENIFMKGATYMSRYTGSTKGGFVIDETWQDNDGLVNVKSAGAPFNAPMSVYSEGAEILPGRYYVMPVFKGDHMSLQGGLTKRINVRPFYLNLAKLIAQIA